MTLRHAALALALAGAAATAHAGVKASAVNLEYSNYNSPARSVRALERRGRRHPHFQPALGR